MQASQRILVTGASGFVGNRLVNELGAAGHGVRAVGRKSLLNLTDDFVLVDDINAGTDWTGALIGVGQVIHAAARVHVMSEVAADPLAEFRAVNVDGTLNLARQAAAAGVRRFVFISSIKVNGEQTDNRPAFAPDDSPSPEDPYGISKFEAEAGLQKIAAETGMEVVIIRPPLVYGPGVKGNFRSLLKLASLPVPLPLGAIDNHRSLVFLGNLVDFIIHASQHPAAANQVFLVSDDRDMSTSELLGCMRVAMGRRPLLLPVPGRLLWRCTELIGRGAIGQRLFGSLQLDVSKNKQLLDWTPPYTVEQGIAETVKDFLDRNSDQ